MRKAFTLIELLISVVLIALMMTFLYNAMGILKSSTDSFSKKNVKLKERDFLFTTLHRDIFESREAKTISTQNKDYDILQLKTNNSFYDLIHPYVTYIVAKEDKKFLRLESHEAIQIPILAEKAYEVFADVLAKEVEIFRVYGKNADSNQSQNGLMDGQATTTTISEEAFVFLKIKNEEPIIFEIAK